MATFSCKVAAIFLKPEIDVQKYYIIPKFQTNSVKLQLKTQPSPRPYEITF